MEIDEAIKNLEITMQALDKAASDEKNYNTDFGYLLEQMSYEMKRNASNLREMRYMYC